jgi:hypothetical protein
MNLSEFSRSATSFKGSRNTARLSHFENQLDRDERLSGDDNAIVIIPDAEIAMEEIK